MFAQIGMKTQCHMRILFHHRIRCTKLSHCVTFIFDKGSNMIIRQPDQVSKTGTMARGTKVLFAATSDHFPVIQQRSSVVPVFLTVVRLVLISSDYYNLSLISYTGQCVQIPICHLYLSL